MPKIVFHPRTRDQFDNFQRHLSHAVIFAAPKGAGKETLSLVFIAELLGITDTKVRTHPYVKILSLEKEKSIGIEAVRDIEHFLSLKVPTTQSVSRVVFINGAQALTHEAQNALLKTLEEPPEGTIFVLATASEQALLPTVRSRAVTINILPPTPADLVEHFVANGHSEAAIALAAVVSGGLPGLMTALLNNAEHELMPAVSKARELLGLSMYDRLTEVDGLSKDKELAVNTLFILQQMAHVQISKSENAQADRWSKILQQSYEASEAIEHSGQIKLVLVSLMLNLG